MKGTRYVRPSWCRTPVPVYVPSFTFRSGHERHEWHHMGGVPADSHCGDLSAASVLDWTRMHRDKARYDGLGR